MIAIAESPVIIQRRVSPEADRLTELGKTISASRLGLWLGCRLKFYFRYMLQIQKPTTPSMHAGSTVHSVLQHWNMSRWRREPFALERFKTLFDTQWASLQTDARIRWRDKEEAERASASRALEHYLTHTPIKSDERPEAVEVTVEADLSRHGLPTLIGVIDLVRAGGRIVDFKISGKSPEPQRAAHAHEIQLTSYSVLYRDSTGRRESGLGLHHLVRTKVPKLVITEMPPATEHQRTRLFRQIESYQAGLARRDFVPSPGFHCAACEYWNDCRAWCG